MRKLLVLAIATFIGFFVSMGQSHAAIYGAIVIDDFETPQSNALYGSYTWRIVNESTDGVLGGLRQSLVTGNSGWWGGNPSVSIGGSAATFNFVHPKQEVSFLMVYDGVSNPAGIGTGDHDEILDHTKSFSLVPDIGTNFFFGGYETLSSGPATLTFTVYSGKTDYSFGSLVLAENTSGTYQVYLTSSVGAGADLQDVTAVTMKVTAASGTVNLKNGISFASVPEPGSFVLFAGLMSMAGLGAIRARRRKNARS